MVVKYMICIYIIVCTDLVFLVYSILAYCPPRYIKGFCHPSLQVNYNPFQTERNKVFKTHFTLDEAVNCNIRIGINT